MTATTDEDPPYAEALGAGAVPLLVAALQPPRVDGTALEAIFEAAWALTNLAVRRYRAGVWLVIVCL